MTSRRISRVVVNTRSWVSCKISKWISSRDFGFTVVAGKEVFVHGKQLPEDVKVGETFWARIEKDGRRLGDSYRVALTRTDRQHQIQMAQDLAVERAIAAEMAAKESKLAAERAQEP